MAWSGTVDSVKACAHGARDGSADGGHALGLGDVGGNSVECRDAMPENGIDVSDPGRGDRPTLDTGLRSTTFPFVRGGVVLFHSTVRVEHSNWITLGERASWPK